MNTNRSENNWPYEHKNCNSMALLLKMGKITAKITMLNMSIYRLQIHYLTHTVYIINIRDHSKR